MFLPVRIYATNILLTYSFISSCIDIVSTLCHSVVVASFGYLGSLS